jgi:hypothetical protein
MTRLRKLFVTVNTLIHHIRLSRVQSQFRKSISNICIIHSVSIHIYPHLGRKRKTASTMYDPIALKNWDAATDHQNQATQEIGIYLKVCWCSDRTKPLQHVPTAAAAPPSLAALTGTLPSACSAERRTSVTGAAGGVRTRPLRRPAGGSGGECSPAGSGARRRRGERREI